MELHERLAMARKDAGFATATEAAEALGIPYPTYAGHENGSSGFRKDKGAKYARKFKVRFEWLMLEQGPMKGIATPTGEDPVVAAFSRVLPKLPEERRQRLLADLRDAIRLEGIEESEAEPSGSSARTGE